LQESSTCSPERPNGVPVQPLSRCEPPRCAYGAARHLRTLPVSSGGSDSSRCRIPPPDTTAFNRGSFSPRRPGAARGSPREGPAAAADLLRPSAEEAKPDEWTSDAPCREMAFSKRGLHASPRLPRSPCTRSGFLRPLPSTPLPRAPPRQARTHRRRVRTSELPEPRRLPPDRPRPCDRSGPVTCAFSHLHGPGPAPLSLAASRSSPVKGLVVASNYPVRHDPPFGAPRGHGEDASPRCLQPTHKTSTLRSIRFPDTVASRPPDLAIFRPRDHAPRWSFA